MVSLSHPTTLEARPAPRPQPQSCDWPRASSNSWYQRWGKRCVDSFLAAVLLLALAPLMGVVAVSVRLSLGPGGVLYRQRRVGLRGTEFTILKFRTMKPDRRVASRPYDGVDRRRNHKSEDDPRHSRFGMFARSTSLDELPQLVNVLKGEMSLVGPRPELASIVRKKGLGQHSRHRVRPGITGPFQLSSLRSGGCLELGFDLDVAYTTQVKLETDCRYLLRTLAAPIRRRGR